MIRFLGWIACAFTCAVCTYAKYLDNATVVYGDNLYFLVSERENVEVGAYFAQQQGGAGNVFSYQNRSYAVLCVYTSESEGNKAQSSVQDKGEAVSLLEIPVGDMYFKTKAQKKKAPIVKSAFALLEQNIRALENTVNALDNGATQENCKRLLAVSEKQFLYMAKEYKTAYFDFSEVCKRFAERLHTYQNELVQSKDLRAEICALCVEYLDLRAEFSL